MKNITKFFKKNYIYILCFVFPIIIFLISSKIADFRPFGKNVITLYDGYHQYPGFAAYFSKVLKGSESLLYSFKGGLGTNFYAIAVYYLFNPTSFLLFLFKNDTLYIYYEFFIFLKIGLCGLTCAFLLNYLKYKKNTIFIFSTAYALCAYNLLYFSNFMWTDSLVLFPIVIISLHRLIYENKKLMYLILLSITIISNFYIGYMICIFLLIYFIYNYFLIDKNKKRKDLIKDFIVLSLCAGLISTFALLPVTLELFMGKNALFHNSYTNYFKFDTDIITMFYKFTPGSSSNKDISSGTVNLYVSLLTIIYVIFSYFNKTFSKKEKILNSFVLLYFAISISFNLFDYSWQLFQRPIWYPVRYAFIIDLFLILIASKSFENRNEIKIKNIYKFLISFLLMGLILAGVVLIYSFKFKFDNVIKLIALLLSGAFILEYTVALTSKSKFLTAFITILFMSEIIFNSILSFKILSVSSSFEYEKLITSHHNRETSLFKESDTSFYRAEFYNKHSYNNGFFYNYNGISFFSSVRNNNPIDFLDNYTDVKVFDNCSVNYGFYNPILNDLIGLKYIVGSRYTLYYTVAFNENNIVYENKGAFNLGYMVNEDIYDVVLKEKLYNENIENIVDGMLGYKLNLYEDASKTLENLKLTKQGTYKQINKDEPGYLVYDISNKPGFYILDSNMYLGIDELSINDENVDLSIYGPLFLNENDVMKLKLRVLSERVQERTEIHYIPYDKYLNFANYIKQNEMQITKLEKDDYIEASVVATTDKNVLFTTIPYDEGWSIYVDGNKQNYKSTLDNAFISLKLSPGEHNIIFKYTPRGLILGIKLSISGLLLSIFYLVYKKKK